MLGKSKKKKRNSLKFDVFGFNKKSGFNKDGIHKHTGTFFDLDGLTRYGDAFDTAGFNKDGLNKDGFNKDGIHNHTGTLFNKDGLNKDGFNKDGYDENGFNKDGYNSKGEFQYDEHHNPEIDRRHDDHGH